MPRYVAFIRAINVGVANRVKMVDLAAMLVEAGCSDVSWYLQSGNMFFADRRRPETVATAIEVRLAEHGLMRTDVMVRTPSQLRELIERRPFGGHSPDEFFHSVSFLRRPPSATPLERLVKEGATVRYLDGTVVCLAIPRDANLTGGASGLIEKPWGTPSTTRWWNVVEAIAERCS